jgi:hypothetical protein
LVGKTSLVGDITDQRQKTGERRRVVGDNTYHRRKKEEEEWLVITPTAGETPTKGKEWLVITSTTGGTGWWLVITPTTGEYRPQANYTLRLWLSLFKHGFHIQTDGGFDPFYI